LRSDDFILAIPGCELTEMPIAKWIARVRAEAEEQISQIEANARSRASEMGLSPVAAAVTKRLTAGAEEAEKYYDWFVRFQLGGQGYDQIRRRENVSRQAVVDGVKSVAAAARVTLRRGASGRPKGAVSDSSGWRGRVTRGSRN
jgi:hypothetical protein